jgi:hypothetical protein
MKHAPSWNDGDAPSQSMRPTEPRDATRYGNTYPHAIFHIGGNMSEDCLSIAMSESMVFVSINYRRVASHPRGR